VDGENLRFKGMSADNLQRDNAELLIAQDSFNYMDRVRQRLATHLFGKQYCGTTLSDTATTETSVASRKRRDFDNVYVFMDGQRPRNKVIRTTRIQVDHGLIRCALMAKCRDHAPLYKVVELVYGESELFMYLNRDRSADLNVFLTTDSDCLSVMYGHCPTIDYYPANSNHNSTSSPQTYSSVVPECIRRSSEQEYFDRLEQQYGGHRIPTSLLSNTTRDILLMNLVDFNDVYAINNGGTTAIKSPPKLRIQGLRDSCVFAHISERSLYLYGMDFLQQRQIRLPPKVFRIFCALSGTDFTRPLLSATLMENFIRNVTLPAEAMTRVQRDLQFLESSEATLSDTSTCIVFVLLAALHCADANNCRLPLRLKSLSMQGRGKDRPISSEVPTESDGNDDNVSMRDYYAQVLQTKSCEVILDELTLACDTYLAYITSGIMPDITIPNVCSSGEYLHKIINGLCTKLTPTYYHRFYSSRKKTITSSLDKLKDMCQWQEAYPNLLRSYYEVYIHPFSHMLVRECVPILY